MIDFKVWATARNPDSDGRTSYWGVIKPTEKPDCIVHGTGEATFVEEQPQLAKDSCCVVS